MSNDKPQSEHATAAWDSEVNAEAANLLHSGEASSPFDAHLKAQDNVRARRATRAAALQAEPGSHLSSILTKVLQDQGGPL